MNLAENVVDTVFMPILKCGADKKVTRRSVINLEKRNIGSVMS